MSLRRSAVIASAAAVLMGGPAGGAPPVARATGVRLHHLHFRTSEVAEAMSRTILLHGGTRTIVPGLGAGVRVEDSYLLFDVQDRADRDAPLAPNVASAFVEAAHWLAARGVDASATEAGGKILARVPAELTLDHIGFATLDLDAVVTTLRAAGAIETRRTTDSVFYRTDAVAIEMTRETELPDAFWCPMHPHVRAPYLGKCPICSMDLVAIAPPRVGEYHLDVTPLPAAKGKGLRGLKLRIRDPDSGEDVRMFTETHERLLHLFVIGRDLQYFAHEHPVQTDAGFQLDVNVPPGAYMLIADFLPGGGYPQMIHRAMVSPGHGSSPFGPGPTLTEDLTDKVVDGVRVKLAVSKAATRPEAVLGFSFADAVTHAPIRDLQLYLGSAGHLLVVSPDLTDSIHAHPEDTTSGPDINFGVGFPTAGLHKVWIQVQRAGKVITAPFVVNLQP